MPAPIAMGSTETGLSVFWPDEGLDEGPILMQKKVAIGPDETLGDVYFKQGKTRDAVSQWQASLREFQKSPGDSDPDEIAKVNRKLDDDIVASFVRTGDDLALELESPNWKLDRGKSYPVKMTLGPVSVDTEVAAEANSVSTALKDKKLMAALRSASALNVVGAGATIKVPLDKSTAAFERLDQCVEKNNKAVETNPFVAPARRPWRPACRRARARTVCNRPKRKPHRLPRRPRPRRKNKHALR